MKIIRWLQGIPARYKALLKRRYYARVRRITAGWGIDLSGFSDDELDAAIRQLHDVAMWGYTYADATRALKAMGKAWKDMDRNTIEALQPPKWEESE